MKTIAETLKYIDYLIGRYVPGGAHAGTPEATEAALDSLDLVREAILTDREVGSSRLTAYTKFLVQEGCGSLNFCHRQRRMAKDAQPSNDELLSRLKEFWGRYLKWDERPKTPEAE